MQQAIHWLHLLVKAQQNEACLYTMYVRTSVKLQKNSADTKNEKRNERELEKNKKTDEYLIERTSNILFLVSLVCIERKLF